MPCAPPHRARVLGERSGLGARRLWGRIDDGFLYQTASPARPRIARVVIIDHTPDALCPPCCPPGSAVVLEMNEEPAALLSELRRERRRRVGVYGKVLRSP